MIATLNRPVLVLNKHWLAVHICTVRRALSLVYQGLARIVTEDYETYDFESWRELSEYGKNHGLMISTPNFQLRVPQVVVLGRYQSAPPRTVRFNRRNIYMRDGYRCQYCGIKPAHDDMTVDHVIPRSRGGKSVWENVVLACTSCNTKKGNQFPGECEMHPLAKPVRPSWMATLRIIPNGDDRTVWERFVDSAYWETNLRE